MDYHYPVELNEDFGEPLTPDCQEVGTSAVFTRKFSKATVSVDCNSLSGKLEMADGRVLSSAEPSKESALSSGGGYGGRGFNLPGTKTPTESAVDVVVDVAQPVSTVDAREVSFTWDIYALRHSSGAQQREKLRSPARQRLMRELRPFVLRVSGTGCENMQLASGPYIPTPPAVTRLLRSGGGGTNPANVTLDDWSDVAKFAAATDASLVLGLNMLLRDWPGDGSQGCAGGACPWNPANARAWIAHNKQVPGLNIEGYELGMSQDTLFTVKKNIEQNIILHDRQRAGLLHVQRKFGRRAGRARLCKPEGCAARGVCEHGHAQGHRPGHGRLLRQKRRHDGEGAQRQATARCRDVPPL